MNNTASGFIATIGGGLNNVASDVEATVGGGGFNNASGRAATIAGGGTNVASGRLAAIGGGVNNVAEGFASTVGGGEVNHAFSEGSAVGGGILNNAIGFAATVGGGSFNTARGDFSAVSGGSSNTAAGAFSFAAGRHAQANHDGAFVWGDSAEADFASTAANQFLIRAAGGVGINTNDPAGFAFKVNGSVAGVGNYVSLSDTRYKQNVATFPNALEAILRLRGVTFDWKRTNFPSLKFAEGRQIGFIAQEVEKVLPELVTTDREGYKSVAYTNVVAVLVEAIKAQQRQMEIRDRKIAELEVHLIAVLQRLDDLETGATDK